MSGAVKRRLRAPTADGAALIEPPLAQVPALIERNRKIGAEFEARTGIRRKVARFAVINGSREQARFDLERPIILTGHQPELFHPGVWFKNFLASAIAARVEGHAANLIVDNDEVRSASIRVPTQDGGEARVVHVPFDDAKEPKPWEGRPVFDPEMFRAFAANVGRVCQGLIEGREVFRGGMLLDRLWPLAIEEMEKEQREIPAHLRELAIGERAGIAGLGSVLATARRHLEAQFGVCIQDHPVSHLVYVPTFSSFLAHVFDRHRELHTIHNAALAEYRIANHIRSRSHPVPELAREGDWYELPFWLWTVLDRRRRHLFVRATAEGHELTDRESALVRLPRDAGEYPVVLAHAGVRLRPRALVTTMYARLVLSDVFIHGIGGAKYDELTDLIIERFFGIQPPGYVTATATFRLPIERPEVSVEDVRRSALRLRDFEFRPEALLRAAEVRQDRDLEQQLLVLAAEKREFLARHDLRRCGPEVYGRLARINAKMRERLAAVEQDLRARHAELIEELRRSQLLGSREFSFVLFPSEILPARLLDLCKVSS